MFNAYVDSLMTGKHIYDLLIYEGESQPIPPKWWEEYGELAESVTSNGIDNFIDTYLGTQPNLIIEMGITYLKSGVEQSAVGAYDLNKVVIEAGSVTSGGNAFYACDDDRTWDVTGIKIETGRHYDLRYEFRSGLQVMYVDGVEVHRTTNTYGAMVGLAMVLFARNYGTASSGSVRQNYINAKWTYFRASIPDGEVLSDYKPFYISKKSMIDWKNRTHEVGVYTMIDMVREKATPLYGAPLVGERIRPWRKVSAITFDSDKTYPTINLGAWKDYNKVSFTFNSEDTSNKDLFFGWFNETGMFEWNNGLMGYDGDTFVVNSEITNDPYTVTPNLTSTQKGDGTDKTIVIEYTSTSGEIFYFGANADEAYTKKKNAKSLVLENTVIGTNITLLPAILREEYQGYPVGSVGFIDDVTEIFYGSTNFDYNFIAIE